MAGDFGQPLDSAFKRMSDLVRVRDILTPFAGRHDQSESVYAILTELRAAGRLGDPVLIDGDWGDSFVYHSDAAFGGEQHADDYDGVTVHEECDDQINLSQYVSSDTSIFEMIRLFAEHDDGREYYVVIDGNECVGIVRFGDVMKPAGRVCLFALTLELEIAAMRLCSRFAEQCWRALSKSRQRRTLETFKKRGGEELISIMVEHGLQGESRIWHLMLDCTMMIDKATMITKCNLTMESHRQVKKIFQRAERLRNACAHPALAVDPVPFAPAKMWGLVHDCHELIDTFRRLTAKPHDSV